MTSHLQLVDEAQATAVQPSAKTWFVVSQVKSHRVVYFTDDPGYTPPSEGDWYYVSPYQGDLPKAMSLRNCWGWRFNGMEFVDAREKKKPDAGQTLLASNKEALHKLLRDKIDVIRKPLAPVSAAGGTLRALRLEEARTILGGMAGDATSCRLLPASAAVRGISLRDMAQRTVDAHENETRLLLDSELLRDEIAVAIDTAIDQQQLMHIRQRLMNELAPQSNEKFKPKPEHTTPRQLLAAPTPDELQQEKFRLSVQLRLKVNAMRRGHVSEYLLDDMVLKHKGRIAQEVLAQGGQMPKNIDATVLISHAAGRGQTLVQAAKDVLTEMDETAGMLLSTEQLKDAILSKIATVSTFKEIEAIGKAIHGLSVQSQAGPASTSAFTVSPVVNAPAAPAGARGAEAMAVIRDRVIKASRLTPEISAIPKVDALDAASFRSMAKAGTPFIVQGVVNQWPLTRLTPQTLQERFASLPVRARVADYAEKAFTPQRQQQEMSLAEYFELIAQNTIGLPPYLGNQALPQLSGLCQWPEYFQTWATPKIWLGPAGTVTPLHCDYDDNLFAQIWGQKRFLLYPPHHAEFLYLREANPVLFGSPVDPEAPDYETFPLAPKVPPIECVVCAGEMLYLPTGWFHHVRALELSLSVNRWTRDQPLVLNSR